MSASRFVGANVPGDDVLIALLKDERLGHLASVVAPPAPTGRPRLHHAHLMLAITIMVNNRNSYRHLATELQSRHEWRKIRKMAKKHAGVSFRISKKPPTLAQLRYFHDTFLSTPSATEALEEYLLGLGLWLAEALKLAQHALHGTLTTPTPEQLVIGDGTTVPSLWTRGRADSAAGKNKRYDTEASDHKDGTERIVHGHKFVITGIRGSMPGQRVFLTARPQRSSDEATDAVDAFVDLSQAGLGAKAVLYDGAIRGAHQDRLIREAGQYVINAIAAKSRSKSGKKTHKKTLVDVHTCACGIAEKLFAFQGAVCKEEVDSKGARHLVPLNGRRVKRVGSTSARLYVEYMHRCACGQDDRLRWPLHNAQTYTRRGINLSENLRAVPESSPLFERLKGRRSDVESANHSLKRPFDGRRSRKLGRVATHVEVLGYAIFYNARLRLLVERS